MKIALRADASRRIGTGHVRRSLSLAQALREGGGEVRFVTRELGVGTRAMIEAAGFAVHLLPAPDGSAVASSVPHGAWAETEGTADAAQTAATLRDWAPDWVGVDHYAFDAEWHDAVRLALGCRIVAIDDLADRALAADLVVDHNYHEDHRAKYENCLPSGTALLAGPRFALLDPVFASARRYAPDPAVRSIGVFLGGIDRDNVTAAALDAIGLAGFEGPVEIVLTAANPNLETVRELAARRRETKVTVDLPDLAGFFSRHDLQIGAGGGATWERCCIGSPTLLLVVAENQLAVVPGLAANGVVATAEPLGTTDPRDIATALRGLIADADLRRGLSQRARALVDGLGARRVALRLLSDLLTVRPATADDARLMHDWRNHPVIRRVSRQSDAIEWADHLAWLDRVLADPSRTLMIATVGEIPVGVIRFDRLDARRLEVSLYVDPSYHGLGLGSAMLRAAERPLPDGLDIVAEVIEGNLGSARMFESAGYTRVDGTHWIKPALGRSQAQLAG